MAEKRVSVRLAAVGGRQVRAELEGVGEAGARGFGRLSREMEMANTRLAAFARRARIAAAAAAGALAAAATAMIRSGLSTVDAQAKLAASLDTTVESIQVLERAGDLAGVSMGQIEQATVQLTRRLSQAAAGAGPATEALRRLRLSAGELQALPLDQRIALIQDRLAEFVPEAERAAVASQLFGDRAALVFTRIDTATLRQATQDVRDFGVVVSDQDARQIERTNDAISRLGLIWRGVSNQLAVAAAPALEAVANAMAAVARTTGPLGIAIRTLFDNLGRLVSIAGTFAALMAGRWVAGLAAAALSVRGLATALVFLRGYQLVSRPLPAEPLKTILPGGQAMTDTHRLMSGVRKLPGNRLQVSASVSLPGPERAMGTRDADRRLAALFPHLGPVEWERSWSGWIAMTADEFPRLQEPAPGLLIGYGYSGRGLALSTVMGRELARRATGTPLAELAFPGGSVRPIPMASLAPYGAAALLVLYRLQDRIEDAIYLRGAGTPRA